MNRVPCPCLLVERESGRAGKWKRGRKGTKRVRMAFVTFLRI